MNEESRKAGKEIGYATNRRGRAFQAGKDLRSRGITQRIIGAAIAVHRDLGPGFLEAIYEEALAVEFALSGIAFVRQKPTTLFYKDHQIGEHRLDFVIENLVVVELKAIRALEDIHFAIGRSYLKATGLQDGLLLNFATSPLTIKRFCRERSGKSSITDLLL